MPKQPRRSPTDEPPDPRKHPHRRTSISLRPWHMARADELAKSHGVSRSEFLAIAIDTCWNQRSSVSAMLESPAVRTAMLQMFSNPEVMRTLMNAHRPNSSPIDEAQFTLFAQQALEGITKKPTQ